MTVQWEQTSGPTVSLEGENDAVARFEAAQAGTYAFRITANDGFDTVRSEVLVFIDPPASTIYVSQREAVAPETCGSREQPCTSVTDALRVLAGNDGLILVGAATTPYNECLTLSGNTQLIGGFVGENFDYSPDTARPNVDFVCGDDSGHELTEAARIQDVTLSPSGISRPQVVTTVFASGTTQLQDVDVRASVCGGDCTAVGLSVLPGATVVLDGVNVSLTPDGFESVGNFVGIDALDATLTVRGEVTARAADDTLPRGNILANANALGLTSGIRATTSAVEIINTKINIGLAALVEAIGIDGGEATVRGSSVEVFSLGAVTALGVFAESCAAGGCTCDFDGCDTEPLLSVIDSQIRLTSPAGAVGPVPCLGVGVGVNLARAEGTQTIQNTTIEMVSAFAQSVGVFVGGEQEPDRFGGIALLNNTLRVDGGRSDATCTALTGLPEVLPFGALGIGASTVTAQIEGNTLTVGGHDASAIGVQLIEFRESTVVDNDVVVGVPTGNPSRDATGMVLDTASANLERSLVSGNQISVGMDTQRSIALDLSGNAPYLIENNFLYGGDGVHSAGLFLRPRSTVVVPIVVHNTIHGGGYAGATLTSRAIIVAGDAGATADTVVPPMPRLDNNLIDFGRGTARRYGIDNLGATEFAARTNGGQVEPLAVSATLDLLVSPAANIDGEIQPWNVVSLTSSEVLTIGRGEELDEEIAVPIAGRASALWAGPTLIGQILTASTDTRAEILSLNGGSASALRALPLNAGGIDLTPLSLVVGDAVADNARLLPLDLVFTHQEPDNSLGLYYARDLSGSPVRYPLQAGHGAVNIQGLVRQVSFPNRVVAVDQNPGEAARLIPLSESADVVSLRLDGLLDGPIDDAQFLNLRPFVANNSDELYLRSGNEFIMIRDFDPALPDPRPDAELRVVSFGGGEPLPCERSGTPIEIVNVFSARPNEFINPIIFFYCADGRLELFEDAVANRPFRGSTELGSDVTQFAVDVDRGATPVTTRLLIARNSTVLELYTLVFNGALNQGSFAQVGSYAPPATGAHRVTGNSPGLQPTFEGLDGFDSLEN
ncbi:MAG: hypothetical protein AAF658_04500, partial [Myxococcota bacterium]